MISGCVALAVSNAFVLDDAFISFRYARNLIETGELTWNPGERVPVEGYTNFLWTLLLAGVMGLGSDPVMASQLLGLFSFLGSLIATYRLAVGVLGSPGRAVVAVGLLGTNYTFSCFATGGLETQLQALLITGCAVVARRIAWAGEKKPRPGLYATLSVLTAAAVMTRLDSALPCSIFFAWVWMASLRKRPPAYQIYVRVIASGGPVLLLLGPWLGWKLAYYGEILPNTYYSKVLEVSAATLMLGLGYGLAFVLSYQLLPCLVLGLAMGKRLLRRDDLLVLALVIVGWSAYLVRVGGDFMEFRMVVPVLPLMFVVVTAMIYELRHHAAQVLLVTLVVFGSGFHAWSFTDGEDLETVASLRGHIENERQNWPRVGEVLGELFAGAAEPVTIATTAAGAIPYYSRLPTVDMLGLNDLWVARHGTLESTRAGHSKLADLEYLLRRRVQLVLGHPQVDRLSGPTEGEAIFRVHQLRLFSLVVAEPDTIPESARVIEIPIDAIYGIKVLYLVPNPRVDEVIEQRGIRTWALDRG